MEAVKQVLIIMHVRVIVLRLYPNSTEQNMRGSSVRVVCTLAYSLLSTPSTDSTIIIVDSIFTGLSNCWYQVQEPCCPGGFEEVLFRTVLLSEEDLSH